MAQKAVLGRILVDRQRLHYRSYAFILQTAVGAGRFVRGWQSILTCRGHVSADCHHSASACAFTVCVYYLVT